MEGDGVGGDRLSEGREARYTLGGVVCECVGWFFGHVLSCAPDPTYHPVSSHPTCASTPTDTTHHHEQAFTPASFNRSVLDLCEHRKDGLLRLMYDAGVGGKVASDADFLVAATNRHFDTVNACSCWAHRT